MTDFLLTATTPALVALSLAAALLVVVTDWRVSFVALLVVYAAVAALITPLVLLEVAGVKLLVGLLVVGILTLTGAQLKFGRSTGEQGAADGEPARRPLLEAPTNLPFRFAATAMAGAAAWFIATQPGFVLPGLDAEPAINTASFLLMALGLLNLGLTEEPINAGLGLLTLLLGFELFYAAVEPSLAIMALLAGVEFSIALAVSYLALTGHRLAETREAA